MAPHSSLQRTHCSVVSFLLSSMSQKITPFLWFDTQALEAAKFYTAIFPNSKILESEEMENTGPDEKQTVQIISFELNGQKFTAMNAGPVFKFNEAVSFLIDCKDQEEVDYYWEKLLEGGGTESQCGWLKDKFGLSWQVVPQQLSELMSKGTDEQSARVVHAMMKMVKLEVAELQKAFDGE
jgi:predicted 3-demethylubiquinone-9 3-methyltransferase (glyoxalase superfamily)